MASPVFDNSYAALSPQLFERVTPDISPAPKLIQLNSTLANNIGLDVNWFGSNAGLGMMSGQKMPKGADPIAMVYGGHQFGHWSGRLGDGRACLLGEVIGVDGVRQDIVLKGSGPTPYSRRGDGKSALGPVLREYIVSEAMAAYGVPTTRALAAIATGENVSREMETPGGILVRTANSHVRVGTFQYLYAQGDMEGLKELADYVIARHFPEIDTGENPYQKLLEKTLAGQASLVARWMGLGFIHGVMNTDNMQIAGETLDYGPCAFMDDFHPQKTFSSIDQHGRYAWGNQPQMALWNLTQLAQALSPLLNEDENKSAKIAQDTLGKFGGMFQSEFTKVFAAKLGIPITPDIGDFLQYTFNTLTGQQVDFTLFFRRLTAQTVDDGNGDVCALFNKKNVAEKWLAAWKQQGAVEGKEKANRLANMRTSNPIYIPRNHQIEKAIQAGVKGDFTHFEMLVEVLKTLYTVHKQAEEFENAPLSDEIVTQTFCGT